MSEKTFKELDELIEASGLKLDFIADEMEISRQRLYTIRLNPASMGIDQMEKIANILNVEFMDIYQIYKNFTEEVAKNAT